MIESVEILNTLSIFIFINYDIRYNIKRKDHKTSTSYAK